MFFSADDINRFCDKVGIPDEQECLPWVAHKNNRGYGVFRLDGKNRLAHRVSYTMFVGVIPEHLVIDHKCGNSWCINPEHLEAVTQSVNRLRASPDWRTAGLPAWAVLIYENERREKTECSAGHPLTPGNIHPLRHGGIRCKTCRTDRVLSPKRKA